MKKQFTGQEEGPEGVSDVGGGRGEGGRIVIPPGGS